MALSVSIVSRDGEHWSGEASYVRVPSVTGAIGIMPRRQPMLAALATGDLKVTTVSGEELSFRVDEGFVSVDSDVVTVAVRHRLDK